MELYITGTGQRIWVHSKKDCLGDHCVIHNPSDHKMREWATHWRQDRYLMERLCVHGVGHPDPDDLAFKELVAKKKGKKLDKYESVHGCCKERCCCESKEDEKLRVGDLVKLKGLLHALESIE